MDDKTALKLSNAGMRLIAQTTIFNQGDFERLGQYISQNYDSSVLDETSGEARKAELNNIYSLAGKMRIVQVIGTDKHQVIVALKSEHGGTFIAQMVVSEDYPHKVLKYHLQPMDASH